MKQLKSIQVMKQWSMLDNIYTDYRVFSTKNLLLTQYLSYNKLLKLQYPKYYKYGICIYSLLKKKVMQHTFRTYLQLWSNHLVLLPHYQFVKQIHMREVLFFKSLSELKPKISLPLNKKFFLNNPYKKVLANKFYNLLPGGTNYLVKPGNTIGFDSSPETLNTLFKDSAIFKINIQLKSFHANSDMYLFQIFDLVFMLLLRNLINYYQLSITLLLFKI